MAILTAKEQRKLAAFDPAAPVGEYHKSPVRASTGDRKSPVTGDRESSVTNLISESTGDFKSPRPVTLIQLRRQSALTVPNAGIAIAMISTSPPKEEKAASASEPRRQNFSTMTITNL